MLTARHDHDHDDEYRALNFGDKASSSNLRIGEKLSQQTPWRLCLSYANLYIYIYI